MSEPEPRPPPPSAWRHRLHEIIFEADTPAGKTFDVFLLLAILLSVVTVSLETVKELDAKYHGVFAAIEWVLTILFTVEYALRIVCVGRPLRYARSFFGVIDLLGILPTYLSLLFPGTQSLAAIRGFRLLRAFRVFKLARMLREAAALRQAVWESRGKIVVFLTAVLIAVVLAGTTMYLVEGFSKRDEIPSQFTSIPQSMYWAVVTMTTVGYGDVVPITTLGKFVATLLIMVGYSMIIVPTGFVSAEFVALKKSHTTQACPGCMAEGHDPDATFCKHCGDRL